MTTNYRATTNIGVNDLEKGYEEDINQFLRWPNLGRNSSAQQATFFKFQSRKSFWRWWNQLSRLQRYIACVFLCFVSLCIILLLPWATEISFIHGYHSTANKHLEHKEPKSSIIIGLDLNDQENVLKNPEEKNENFPLAIPLAGKNENLENLEMKKSKTDIEPNQHFEQILPPMNEEESKDSTDQKQKAVVAAFLHAWKGYKNHAWGHDHLKPITKTFQNWFGLGLTIVDSLDTMYIMELEEEFNEAKEWIKEKLDFKVNRDVNFFETTIRVMGGLLSAFHLSKDTLFLDKAIELGDHLMPGFQSSSGIPYSDVNLQTGHAHAPSWGQDSTVSEVSTVQLEFRDLSRITGDLKYENAAFRVSQLLHQLPKKDGLVPMFINAESGQFRSTSTITLGARADSYYEYLLKQWIQTGRTIDWLKEDYIEAINGVMKHLVKHSYPNKLVFVGELLSGRNYSPKMDHLVCYLPGTLALGYHYGLPASHLRLAFELMDTCYNMYAQTATFLSPEIAYFNMQQHGSNDIIIKSNDAHNLLRPETVESLWYLYHLTHNETYREWGWHIFQAFEKHTKVKEGGYTTIGDVRNSVLTKPRDLMESFFLAETLKYLYMLFSDNQAIYSVDKYVFNSEAHLLPIFSS